jgi:hypothetical protein
MYKPVFPLAGKSPTGRRPCAVDKKAFSLSLTVIGLTRNDDVISVCLFEEYRPSHRMTIVFSFVYLQEFAGDGKPIFEISRGRKTTEEFLHKEEIPLPTKTKAIF